MPVNVPPERDRESRLGFTTTYYYNCYLERAKAINNDI